MVTSDGPAGEWVDAVTRRPGDPSVVYLDPRDVLLIRLQAELDRERARRVEVEGRLARFDVATERRLELEAVTCAR